MGKKFVLLLLMLVKVFKVIFCKLSMNVWNEKKASKKEKKQNCKNKSLYKQPTCTGKFFCEKLGEKICENFCKNSCEKIL